MATASSSTETTPLISTDSDAHQTPTTPKPTRSVTFNPTVTSSSPNTLTPLKPSSQSALTGGPQPPASAQYGGQHMLTALNNKIRRRNSQGAPLLPPTLPAQKIGPQRSTRTAQKLKLLPDPEHGESGPDEESGREVYAQFTRIKDPTARRDAARLGREDRKRLPRVTAYCTANSYRMEDLLRFLKGKAKARGTAPKLIDECIYTPYSYGHRATRTIPRPDGDDQAQPHRRFSDSAIEVEGASSQRRERLIEIGPTHKDANPQEYGGSLPEAPESDSYPPYVSPFDTPDFDTTVHTPEIFLFNYGAVVIWGMTLEDEQRFLRDIAKFETEKLGKDDVQTEDFNFYYTREYQARIYNDFISLREKKNYLTKLAISHALAQSVKTSLYEDLVDNTIDTTKEIPAQIATTGKVNLTRRQINMQIGELFILRINIHLQGSVLDSPELMWAEPQLEPVYLAVRSYLEMDQRVGLLTERLDVIADLLTVLKDQLTHTHGEYLEWVVIILIAAEIFVAAINIVVDLYAGVD